MRALWLQTVETHADIVASEGAYGSTILRLMLGGVAEDGIDGDEIAARGVQMRGATPARADDDVLLDAINAQLDKEDHYAHHVQKWGELTVRIAGKGSWDTKLVVLARTWLYIGSISASPTASPLRGYGCVGTQNHRLAEAVVLSTGTPIPAQWTYRRRCRYIAGKSYF